MPLSSERSLWALLTSVLVLGVEFRPDPLPDRIALHRHAERVAPVVEDPDLAAVFLGVPEDVPGDIHARDVLLDLVVPPSDAVHPDDVGDRVVAVAVVERVHQRRPDVLLEVGQVGAIQRHQQLVRDQVDDVRAAQADDQVEVDRSGGQLRYRLVGRVVRRDLDLGRELLLEALDRFRVEVVGVVVDPQRPGLGAAAVLDGLVLVGDRPGDGVVGAGQRQPARPGRLLDDELGGRARGTGRLCAHRRGRVLTGREAGHEPGAGDRPGGSAR